MAPTLFGRVPFGRVSNDPRMLITQNLYLLSLFFLLLGVSITALELWAAVMSFGDTPTTSVTVLQQRQRQQQQSQQQQQENGRGFNEAAASAGSSSSESWAVAGEIDFGSDRTVFKGAANHVRQVAGNGKATVKKYADRNSDVRDDSDEIEEHEAFKFGTYSPQKGSSDSSETSFFSGDYRKYLHANFYVSFHSLFIPTAIGESATALSADAKFVLAHIITALFLCYPAALCVERRKFVLDFIGSVYLVYFLLTVLMTRTVLQPFPYWMATIVAFIVSLVGTTQIAYRREMAEVLISNEDNIPMSTISSGGNNGGGGSTPNNTNANNTTNNSSTAGGNTAANDCAV